MPIALLERRRKSIKTPMLYVPRVDWAAVTAGVKTQWRAVGRGHPKFNLEPPCPVVLHSQTVFRAEPDVCLAVLEDIRREPLGVISPEDLAAEGVASLADFRRYWNLRHEAGFRPLAIVNVYCVRLWRDGDRERFGDELLEHLFGPWL